MCKKVVSFLLVFSMLIVSCGFVPVSNANMNGRNVDSVKAILEKINSEYGTDLEIPRHILSREF